jgi:nitrite reductase/ring-hydroxylating ferredoxin subunit
MGTVTEIERRRQRRLRQRDSGQDEFPYDWERDAAMSRRELLRLVLVTSGAVFAGTLALAIFGRRDDRRRGSRMPIEGGAQLAEGEALYFHYPGEGDQAVLLNLPGEGLVAYSQKCTHLSCSVYAKEGELICPCHDGKFDARTGEPISGPPERPLPRILLEEQGGQLFAVEERP